MEALPWICWILYRFPTVCNLWLYCKAKEIGLFKQNKLGYTPWKIRGNTILMDASAQLLRDMSQFDHACRISSFLTTDKYLIVPICYAALYFQDMVELFMKIKLKSSADCQLNDPKWAIADEEKPMFKNVFNRSNLSENIMTEKIMNFNILNVPPERI